MGSWLKLLGRTDWPVPDAWTQKRPELLRYVRFGGKQPPTEINAGDRLVYYAVGWKRFFAVAEVLSDEPGERTITHEWEAQWPWAVDIRLIVKKNRLRDAPSLLELGNTADRRHRGHVPLTTEQLNKAERALR